MNLDPYAVEVLACHVADIYNEHTKDITEKEIDSVLFDKLGVTFEQFSNVVEALLPYTAIIEGDSHGVYQRGFVKDGYYLILEPVVP